MSVTPSIHISNVIVAEIKKKSMLLPILISSEKDKGRIIETKALLDTGAGGKFIDQNFILENGIRTSKLEKLITVYNVDGTKNKRELSLIMSMSIYKSEKRKWHIDLW